MLLENMEKNGILVVKLLEKRLDAHLAVEFKETLARLISEGHRKILLDLETVEFIDSSGLGAIVSALKRISGENGDLIICSLQDATSSMFKLTRMDKVFSIYTSESEALSVVA